MVSSSSQSKRFYQFLCIKCNYKGDRLTQQKIFILRRPSRAIKTKNLKHVRDSEEGFCWIFLKKWDFLLRKTFFWKPVLWSLSSNNIHRFCLKVWSFYRSRDNQKYCYICFYIQMYIYFLVSLKPYFGRMSTKIVPAYGFSFYREGGHVWDLLTFIFS